MKNANEGAQCDDEVPRFEDDVNEAKDDKKQFHSLTNDYACSLCPYALAVVQHLPALCVAGPKTILKEMKRAAFQVAYNDFSTMECIMVITLFWFW